VTPQEIESMKAFSPISRSEAEEKEFLEGH